MSILIPTTIRSNFRLALPSPQPAPLQMPSTALQKCKAHWIFNRAFCMQPMNVISKLPTPTSMKLLKDMIVLIQLAH